MDLDTHSYSATTQIDLPKIWNLAFPYLESTPEIRKSADAVCSAFARATGVDGLLSLFPLNLVPEAR